METIEACLTDAVFFQKEKNSKSAYYKVVEGVLEVVLVLERYYLYETKCPPAKIDRAQIEELLKTGLDLMELAEKLLPNVIELTGQFALSYSRATSGLAKKTGSVVDVQINKIPSVTRLAEAAPVEPEVQSKFEEPPIIKAPEEEIPMIPTSALDIQRMQNILASQVTLQQLSKYREASPKARSNAAYLTGLRRLLEHLITIINARLVMEAEVEAAYHRLTSVDATAKEIAQQLTLLDAKLLAKLPFDALRREAPDRQFHKAMKDFHQYVNYMIQFEILAPKDRVDRIRTLAQWIAVSVELRQLGNYYMLHSVANALTSKLIRNATGLLEGLTETRRFEIKKLEELFDPKNNYRSLRQAMEETKRCIPYLEVYMHELHMIHAALPVSDPAQKQAYEDKIEQIVKRLCDFQDQSAIYIETVELDRLLQHWILTRPYKNSQELQNLGVSRADGGRHTPDLNKMAKSPPTILDFGDAGTIIFQKLQSDIINDYRRR